MKALVPILALIVAPPAFDVGALRAQLATGESATVVLGRWCARRHLADPPVIRAERAPDVRKPADRAVRAILGATAGEVVRYRHVRLVCGAHVLSEADNWYLPRRLTLAMNRRLDVTDTPFGVVVRPLGFGRRILANERLKGSSAILRIEAVLVTAAGAPFSVVVETYAADLIAAASPDG